MLISPILLLQALISLLEVRGQQEPRSMPIEDSQGPFVILESPTAAANKSDLPVFTPEFVVSDNTSLISIASIYYPQAKRIKKSFD